MPVKKTSKGNTAPAAKKRRGRRKAQGSVRPTILKLLQGGPLTRTEIMERGKFSQAALYLHLKGLRDEGMIEPDEDNRRLRLTGPIDGIEEVAITEVVEQPRQTKSSALMPANLPRALHQALDAVLYRLSPIERVSEKLLVLEQLSRTTPQPVAEVLQLLIDDVRRFAALKPEH